MTPQRDDLLLRLPCYEPAGQSVDLTLDELTQHVLVAGTTGSGKTSLLNEILWQLLHYQAANPALKPGLLILDGKADDTVEKVNAWATAAGRLADVQVLDGDGAHSFPLFGDLKSLAAVDRVATAVLTAVAPMSVDNEFWSESRASAVRAALTLLVYQPVSYPEAIEAISAWLLRNEPPERALRHLSKLANRPGVSPFARQRLRAVETFAVYWAKLECRTRSNVQATLVPLLTALNAAVAELYFAGPSAAPFLPRAALAEGKILVGSVNAITDPEFARFLFRLLKESFFTTLHERRIWSPDRERLAVLFVDELPLVVTPRDATHLATCRSKGAAVIAATQGLAPLRQEVGEANATTLLLNFNSFCFLRARELELELFATRQMGQPPAPPRPKVVREWDEGALQTRDPVRSESPWPQWVCPVGALGRLEAHQAYVAVGAARFLQPVWFVPRFYERKEPAPTVLSSPPTFLPEEELDYEAARLERLMHGAGRKRFAHGHCVAALGNRMDDAATLRWREELNLMLTACALGTPSPESLATLPASWLKGVVGVLASLVHTHAHHPFPKPILHLGQWHGALIVRFSGAEEPAELDGIIKSEGLDYGPTVLESLQLRLQWTLFPSAYRALRPRDRAWLRQHRPELLPALPVEPSSETPPLS